MTAAKILISSFLWLINIDGMSQVSILSELLLDRRCRVLCVWFPIFTRKTSTLLGDPSLRFPRTRIRASSVVDPYLCTDSPSQQAISMGPFPVTEGCGNHAAA